MNRELPCVGPERSIRDAVVCMDASRLGIVLVAAEDRRLLGTVTDGDVRRALLDGVDFAEPVTLLLARKAGTRYGNAITARSDASDAEQLALLRRHQILHLPLIDSAGRVTGLVTRDEFLREEPLDLHAVVMAGGPGLRLMPLTERTPKPMLPVGDRPLLEILIGQIRDAGVRRLHIATSYRQEVIRDYFGDGRRFGVDVTYLQEEHPLGTAGALSMLEVPAATTLIVNGDILTDLDLRAMLAFHREHGADLTMAVKSVGSRVPYGVVECKGPAVERLREKPAMTHTVNAGIYLIEPGVYGFIPRGAACDMTDVIQRLLDAGRRVCGFPVREYWLDIGEPADYERAQNEVKELGVQP